MQQLLTWNGEHETPLDQSFGLAQVKEEGLVLDLFTFECVPKLSAKELERRAKRKEKYYLKKVEEAKKRQAKERHYTEEERYAKDRSGNLLVLGRAWKTTSAKADKHNAEALAKPTPVVVITLYAFVIFRSMYQLQDERKHSYSMKRRVLTRVILPREDVPDAQQALAAIADMELMLKRQVKWRFLRNGEGWPQPPRGFGVWR
jgi:hypothetical protein